MKKLSKDQQSRFDTLCEAIEARNAELNITVNSINLRIAEINAELSAVREKAENTVNDFNEFAQEVEDEIEDFINRKSDKWQEGEEGENFHAWKNAWGQLLEESIGDLDEVEELEAIEIDFADGNYPTSVEG